MARATHGWSAMSRALEPCASCGCSVAGAKPAVGDDGSLKFGFGRHINGEHFCDRCGSAQVIWNLLGHSYLPDIARERPAELMPVEMALQLAERVLTDVIHRERGRRERALGLGRSRSPSTRGNRQVDSSSSDSGIVVHDGGSSDDNIVRPSSSPGAYCS